ncbi:MAG: 4-hydroxy-tetrahydrodipicolinate synthase [Candidatus Dormibacteraeota bacterium]|nr:4-hydroxy-tetrahydrodipicolinate synthase [Candidatus Dormibacteraeota bacterium]MBO0746186.1 4-hydroxy-tetrahydrodipicolinate synthase [Candidatus Dormibacteraeota bacterium]
MKDRKTPRGSVVPLVTPFTADGALDEPALCRLIDFQVANGSHGVSVTGTTGEPSALTLDERERLIALGAEQVAGRAVFAPGTGTNNIDETLRLTRFAAREGVDAALVIVPYYNRPSPEGLYRHFATVLEATDLPILVYNIPGRTATNILPETLARLHRDYPHLVGVKESNKDFEQPSRILHECGRDFLVLSGIELLCYPMLAIGGAGHVSATGNLLPREVAAIYDLVQDGRHREALDLHYRLLPLNEAIFFETNPIPLKWMLAELGLIQPVWRLPLCEPAPATQQRLRGVMAQYDLPRAVEAGR